MCRYAQETDAREIIVGTESGIIYRMQKENPDKTFIPISDKAICPNMKKITLEKVLWSLQEMTPQVTVPEAIRVRAKQAVDWMLEII